MGILYMYVHIYIYIKCSIGLKYNLTSSLGGGNEPFWDSPKGNHGGCSFPHSLLSTSKCWDMSEFPTNLKRETSRKLTHP